ncbi:MAG: hypothetical protein FJ095_03200 [Deltaproteobacteria bacterium]|nr:hypothetical protein [Deltaproteobacteria bacterium]
MWRPLRRSIFAAALALLVVGCTSESVAPVDLAPAEPVVEESEPAALVIFTPRRGAFLEAAEGETVVVKGVGAAPGLTINGEPVTPNEDGSFSTTVIAERGLNLIRAVDDDGSLDVPFLFGDFAPPSKELASALTVRLNASGFKSSDSKNVTLTRLAQLALDDVDLLASLKGQTFSGTFTGGSWSFKVSSTSYDNAKVTFSPRSGGASFQASVANVRVNGTLTVKVLFTKTDAATIGLDAATVNGNIDASLAASGKLSAKGSGVKTALSGFSYDSNNAGFPCCVDWILTKVMQDNVETAVRDNVKKVLETKVGVALNELGLPSAIDLSPTGFSAKVGIKQRFDAASFSSTGASLSVRAHFSAKVDASDPGADAPGWFELGAKPLTVSTTSPVGLTVSLDALNQALHAAWAQGGLVRTLEDVPTLGEVTLSPALPPIVQLTPQGKLIAAVGEVVIDGALAGKPVRAALSVIDEVTPTLDGAAGKLTIVTSPKPVVSLTWLEAEHVAPAVRDLVKSMVLGQVPKFLAPLELPLPGIPLAAIAPSQANKVAVVGPSATLKLDPKTNRAAVQGSLVLVPLK